MSSLYFEYNLLNQYISKSYINKINIQIYYFIVNTERPKANFLIFKICCFIVTKIIKTIENSISLLFNLNAFSAINWFTKLLQLNLEVDSDDGYQVIKSYSWEETKQLPSIDPIKLYKEKTFKNGGNQYKMSKDFTDFV